MKDYLNHTYNADDPELISIQDELPFWSANFGMKILEQIEMRKNLNVLDIGSGFGFPLIEAAQRLGNSSRVYGLDPWKPAIDRIKLKINKLGLTNVEIIEGCAEELPFGNNYFDLIISNNGINNVKEMLPVLKECRRIARSGARMLFTLNLEKTMIEFYNALELTLEEFGLEDSIDKMKKHIYLKRKPVEEIIDVVQNSGFTITTLTCWEFSYRFADAAAMFNYAMIKYWFLPSWKELVPTEQLERVFDMVEQKLNETAREKGELKLTIPYALFECEKY
jgi:arsenite methyltransferase